MKNQTSFVGTAVHLLRRYWIPVAVVALLSLAAFTGQPAWAADGGADIGQTVPTPTPTSPPAQEATATPQPTPDNGDNNGGSDTGGDAGGDTGGDTGQGAGGDVAPVDETAATTAAIEVAPEIPTSTVTLTGTVTAVTLNVRQGPGTTNPVIGRLTAGSAVNVLARNVDGTWFLICCTTGGSNGWVSAEFIAPNFSAAEAAGLGVSNSLVTTTTVTSALTGTVATAVTPMSGNGTVDVLTLNIRQGPSTSTPVVGRFRQDDTFAVQGTNEAGDWYLVCCIPGSQNAGWISAQFATLDSGEADTTPESPAEPAEATPTVPAEATPEPTTPDESTDTSSGDTASGVSDVLW